MEQRRGALQPASEQVCVRRFAERASELAAEMTPRQAGGVSEIDNAKRLEVARIGKILCP